jgi:major membrane immunogen (membrane-anchored lipoprotein)
VVILKLAESRKVKTNAIWHFGSRAKTGGASGSSAYWTPAKCSALEDIPQRIITRQSVEGIDAISGATVTSQAIVNATAKALANGTR